MDKSLREIAEAKINKVWDDVKSRAKRQKEEYIEELAHYLELAQEVGRRVTGWLSVASSYEDALRYNVGKENEKAEVLTDFFTKEPLIETAEFFTSGRTFPKEIVLYSYLSKKKITFRKDYVTIASTSWLEKARQWDYSYKELSIYWTERKQRTQIVLQGGLDECVFDADEIGRLLIKYLPPVIEEFKAEELASQLRKKIEKRMCPERKEETVAAPEPTKLLLSEEDRMRISHAVIQEEIEKKKRSWEAQRPSLKPPKTVKSREKEEEEGVVSMVFGFFMIVLTWWSYANPELFTALFGFLTALSFLGVLLVPLSLLLLIVLILVLIALLAGAKTAGGLAAAGLFLLFLPFLIFGGILLFGLQGLRTLMIFCSLGCFALGIYKLLKR